MLVCNRRNCTIHINYVRFAKEENMKSKIEIIKGKSKNEKLPFFVSKEASDEAYAFHKTLKEYNKTPLVWHSSLAENLQVAGIFTKDESKRFGLNAFKGLGASFALSKILADAEHFLDPQSGKTEIEAFVTATDGNHGKGVAWAAKNAGKKAFVFMPKGSAQSRVDAIASFGAVVEVTEFNYIDSVKHASEFAKERGYVLVQDTGFEGYEEIPNYITQGYTTMVREAISQLNEQGIERPTHVFIQAGVGSVTGAVSGYLAEIFGDLRPIVTVVEPTDVACIYESAKNGEITVIGGLVKTDMAGLNCGEPNMCTWPILRDYADFYAKCPDWVTWDGMNSYANPVGNDEKIISGESGAVDFGLVKNLLENPDYTEYKKEMNLNEDSVILVFNTEGATDPENYNRIVNG